MKKYYSQKGFTLIELLIVIVIIGILAGVLISVIDPGAQQNRAKDANVKATINKVGLATQGFISAYGRVPTDVEFMGSLSDTATDPLASCEGSDYVCNFTVSGNSLPLSCAADNFTNSTTLTNQCYYHYVGDAPAAGVDPHFQIHAASYGISGTTFVFDNLLGTIVP